MSDVRGLERPCPACGRPSGEHTLYEWSACLGRTTTDLPFERTPADAVAAASEAVRRQLELDDDVIIADHVVVRALVLSASSGPVGVKFPGVLHELDQGRGRTLADVFKLRGEKLWNPLATAARAVAMFELYGTIDKPAYEAPPTVAQSSRALERNPDLRDSVGFVSSRHRSWLPTSHLCALHFLFATVDRVAADDFVQKLVTGAELPRDSAIYVLREKLMVARVAGEPIPNRIQLALIIKAWRLYLDGTPTASVKWIAGGPHAEPFPEIAGLERAAVTAPEPESQGGGLT